MPKISVIIPIYNVADYLRPCLDSIINQTFDDIEIICVDDGSTDSSPQILQEYAAKDERIQIITQPNTGIYAARNAGIKCSSAEYIMFIDSDDYIEPDMAELMYNAMMEYSPDIVICDVDNVIDKNVTDPQKIESFQRTGIWLERYVRPTGMYEVETDIRRQIASVVWNKLYKTDTIKRYKVYFQEGFQEDEYYLLAYLLHCRNFYFINKKLYHYLRRCGSQMDTMYETKIALDILGQFQKAYDYIKQYKDITLYKPFLTRDYIWSAKDRFNHINAKFYPDLLKTVRDYTFNCNPSEAMLKFYRTLKEQIAAKREETNGKEK